MRCAVNCLRAVRYNSVVALSMKSLDSESGMPLRTTRHDTSSVGYSDTDSKSYHTPDRVMPSSVYGDCPDWTIGISDGMECSGEHRFRKRIWSPSVYHTQYWSAVMQSVRQASSHWDCEPLCGLSFASHIGRHNVSNIANIRLCTPATERSPVLMRRVLYWSDPFLMFLPLRCTDTSCCASLLEGCHAVLV